jgi:succinate dehydrogenase hydrophobic anchor subunit
VALFVLVAFHLLNELVLNDVETLNAPAFVERWSNPALRTIDWVMVVLALFHGVIGVHRLVDSGIDRAGVRGAVLALVYALAALLGAFVTLVALTLEYS